MYEREEEGEKIRRMNGIREKLRADRTSRSGVMLI